MAHESEIIIRRTVGYSPEEWVRTPFDELLAPEGLHAEQVHADYLLIRFFDAQALDDYFRLRGRLSSLASASALALDEYVLADFRKVFDFLEDNEEKTSLFVLDKRRRASLEALAVDDVRGNLGLLKAVMEPLTTILAQPGYTAYYRSSRG